MFSDYDDYEHYVDEDDPHEDHVHVAGIAPQVFQADGPLKVFLWHVRSWFCHRKIRKCKDCRRNELAMDIESGKIAHECDTSEWQAAPDDTRFCDECAEYWIAVDAGPLDIRWVKYDDLFLRWAKNNERKSH